MGWIAKKDIVQTGPEAIKLFSCSLKLQFQIFFMLYIAEHENFSANKVGIFIFISRENFMLS